MTVRIVVRPNGPLLIKGPLELVDPAGNTVTIPEGKTVALCRCGAAKIKPYCDGAHTGCGFQGAGPAPPRG